MRDQSQDTTEPVVGRVGRSSGVCGLGRRRRRDGRSVVAFRAGRVEQASGTKISANAGKTLPSCSAPIDEPLDRRNDITDVYAPLDLGTSRAE